MNEMMMNEYIEKYDKMSDVFKNIILSDNFKSFIDYVNTFEIPPRFFFSGVGKNWYICEKVTKTFISMGIHCEALDCVHAFHGDMGMLQGDENKIVFFLSKSGSTAEMVKLAKTVKDLKNRNVLKNIDMVGCFLNSNPKNMELFDFIISPTETMTCYEFDDRNLVPSLSINIIQMVLDLMGAIIFNGNEKLRAKYKYNHLDGAIGEALRKQEQA